MLADIKSLEITGLDIHSMLTFQEYMSKISAQPHLFVQRYINGFLHSCPQCTINMHKHEPTADDNEDSFVTTDCGKSQRMLCFQRVTLSAGDKAYMAIVTFVVERDSDSKILKGVALKKLIEFEPVSNLSVV